MEILHEIWSVGSQENHLICCHQMSDFMATLKMHQIQFSAGALPQTPLGELTVLPGPLTVFKGPTSKGWEKGDRGGEERRGERRRERERER